MCLGEKLKFTNPNQCENKTYRRIVVNYVPSLKLWSTKMIWYFTWEIKNKKVRRENLLNIKGKCFSWNLNLLKNNFSFELNYLFLCLQIIHQTFKSSNLKLIKLKKNFFIKHFEIQIGIRNKKYRRVSFMTCLCLQSFWNIKYYYPSRQLLEDSPNISGHL